MTARRDQPMTRNDRASLQLANEYPDWSPRERVALWIGAGLASLALVTLAPRHWSRIGSMLFGGSARILRSPFGPALLAALLARASASHPELRTINLELGQKPPGS